MNRSSFFFSSRRRHTRCSRDWSSDVCSSDLLGRRNRCSGAPRRTRQHWSGDEGGQAGQRSRPEEVHPFHMRSHASYEVQSGLDVGNVKPLDGAAAATSFWSARSDVEVSSQTVNPKNYCPPNYVQRSRNGL